MRQILQIDVGGYPVSLIGTYHPPRGGAAPRASGTAAGKPGVLFVNFGQFDRAGPADLTVQLADRLAEHGYPSFRFDLPGLGDTPGDLPEDFETYWEFVEHGGQAPWTCELVAELKQQFALSGIILGGLCGGALTSVFAAECLRGDVQGLLLFDMQVLLSRPPAKKEAAPGFSSGTALGSRAQTELRSGRQNQTLGWIRSKAREGPCGALARHGRDVAKCLIATFASPKLPPNANLRLIDSLRKLRSSGLPMLVLLAPAASHRILRRDIFPPTRRRRITIIDVARTNHLFTSGGGKQIVLDKVQHWMGANFPPNEPFGHSPIGWGGKGWADKIRSLNLSRIRMIDTRAPVAISDSTQGL